MNSTENTTVAESVVAAPAPLTKEQVLAKIDAQITKLQARRFNVENDIAVPKGTAKVVVLPAIGDEVIFSHGRKTATTAPTLLMGVVVALKQAGPSVDGKRGSPAQVKVQVGDGFDAEFFVIYPAQIEGNAPEQEEDNGEDTSAE